MPDLLQAKAKKRITTAGIYAAATVIAVLFLYPLYYSAINSLRPIVSTPAIIIPKGFELINYYYAVTLIPFFRYFMNSLIILVIGLGISIVVNFFFGYALGRLEAPGKKFVFYLMLSQLMVPFVAIQIPQYILFSNLGIKDSYVIYAINGLVGNAFIVFLYRQYFLSFSKSIDEAALIDGCSLFSIAIKIILPMSKPIISVAIFYEFLNFWNDYMTPYMYLSAKKYPLSMALFGLSYSFPNNPGLKLIPVQNAAAILLMVPTIIVFFLCQKQLVAGITSGGIKE